MTRPIAALDVPLPVVQARIADLRELAHQLDPADRAFAALACACPTACSCDADYSGWAERIAAVEADNRTARNRARKSAEVTA